VIALSGRLGHASAGALASLLKETIRERAGRIVLDMSGVDYISSPGLRVLSDISRALRNAGGALLLKGVRPPVRVAMDLGDDRGALIIYDG
jgi:anti-anti-sigma factor